MRPPVWPWYVTYAVVVALMYLVLGAGGILGFLFLPESEFEGGRAEKLISFLPLIIVCGAIFPFYAVAPFLPKRPWAWYYHLVLIAIGLTSCCFLPFCIALLIFWIKPETKAFFDTPKEDTCELPSDRWTDPISP